jgi:60 kDa SS-A/Ro ribonucleoprotein
MKFNFNLRGRSLTDARYAFVKAGFTNAYWEIYKTLLSATYSESWQSDGLSGLRSEIRSADPGQLGQMAIQLAEQRGLREPALWLTAEMAAIDSNDEQTAGLVARIVQNAVDIPDWLVFYRRATARGQRPGRAVRRQLGHLLNRLDEYQYARLRREAQDELRATLQTLRPKPADAQRKELFRRITGNKVPVRSSWQQEWHVLHQQHYDSIEQRQVSLRDKWKEGISSFRIGYAPLLDNLKPMLCAGVSGKVLKLASDYLGNAAAASRSGVSPLQMMSAWRVLRKMEPGGVGMLTEALEKAILHSSWARSEFGNKGVSVIAMDVSNSMKRPLFGALGAQRFDVGPLLAMLWASRGNHLITGIIGNTWKPLHLPSKPVLMSMDEMAVHEGEAGYATNAHLILQDLLRKRQVVDRVIVFTDCRLWDNRTFNQSAGTDLGHWWRQYRRELAPHARLYLFDLAGYEARGLECLDEDVFLIDGWKEGIPEILAAAETDKELLGNMTSNG